MAKTKFKCSKCGFTTTLVCVDGEWKCDVESHGNGAPGKKCFNCQAPFDGKGGQHEQTAPSGDAEVVLAENIRLKQENADLKETIKNAKLTRSQKANVKAAKERAEAEEAETEAKEAGAAVDSDAENGSETPQSGR